VYGRESATQSIKRKKNAKGLAMTFISGERRGENSIRKGKEGGRKGGGAREAVLGRWGSA